MADMAILLSGWHLGASPEIGNCENKDRDICCRSKLLH